MVNPHEVYVDLSDKLYHIKSDLLEEMSMKALGEQVRKEVQIVKYKERKTKAGSSKESRIRYLSWGDPGSRREGTRSSADQTGAGRNKRGR